MEKSTFIIILLVSAGCCFAAEPDITATERSEIIDSVADQLANNYVDPNLGKKAADFIRNKKEQQNYDNLEQKAELLQALIADMHKVTGDKHLQLADPESFNRTAPAGHKIEVFNPNATSPNDLQQNKRIQEMFKRMNYGLNLNVLEGNIGYLDIRMFVSPRMAPGVFKAIDKIMEDLQDCSAIILDLRYCSAGGYPDVVMYMTSYFFGGEESLILYELYDRDKKKINEYRTRTDIPGECMPDVPVYVLTGSMTFSGGEMFAYGLQKADRATVIGETTAGAAHETNSIGIGHGVMMVLPINKMSHVKTKTDWQGTGVVPDVAAKADEALDVAKDIIQKAKRNSAGKLSNISPLPQKGYLRVDPELPGNTPKVFGQKTIAKSGAYIGYMAFDETQDAVYCAVTNASWDQSHIVKISTKDFNSVQRLSLTESNWEGEPCISPDGKRLFFTRIFPPQAGKPWHSDLYYLDRTPSGWSEPHSLGDIINTATSEWCATLTADNTLYFGSERDGSRLRADIYRAVLEDGEYRNVERLPDGINTRYNDCDPLIAADESFLIFHSNRPGGFGEHDLYISFKTDDGWSEPQNMGPQINSPGWEMGPSLSRDGKYMFFVRRKAFRTDEPSKVYWVSIDVIEQFKK